MSTENGSHDEGENAPGSREDGLEALKIRATLGTSLLTSTGTALAAGLALVALASGLHRVGPNATGLWIAGGVVLFTSAYIGGLAIRRLSARGSHGDWRLGTSAYHFSAQAGAFVVGVLLLATGSVIAFRAPQRVASSSSSSQDRAIGRIESRLGEIDVRERTTRRDLDRLKKTAVVRRPRRPKP